MVNLKELNMKLTKEDIAKSTTLDKILVQALHSLDELDIVIRRLSVSLKEWYSYYNPLVLKLAEPELLIKAIEKKESGEMGAQFSKKDLEACLKYSLQIKLLIDLRKQHFEYLTGLMSEVCPNILKVSGVYVGAKLIAIAGSLKSLAVMRSPTVQVLGAEKALFRHRSEEVV